MEPEIVIALDIGSTYSVYAYQFSSNFKENPSAIRMSDSWGSSNKTHKTSTCLLLKCDTLERIAIGEDAEREYLRLCDIGTESNLKNQAEDYSGRHKPFTLVMSEFIEGLTEDCLEKFERYDGKQKDQTTDAEWNSVIDEKKIRWVITVPAIWNDFAKHAMRESAVMLTIALEPEAAVVHCMYLSDQEKTYMGNLGRVGSKFIVVDMGGGTVDITAVKVLENGHLEQIMMANGGPWGGQSVNDSFSQLVRDVLITKDGHSSFESCTRADLFEMELKFERQKVAIRGKKKHVKSWIKLPLPDVVWSQEKDNIIKHEGHTYSTRISRFTYGIGTYIPFDPNKHPQEKKKEDSSGKMWCKDIFSVHYMSEKKDARRLGRLLLKCPTLLREHKKNALVTMIYGGTEQEVKGIDVATGKEFKTTIVYD
ncbi:hypothetical protein ACJMK2_011755 [Sinanodonta woodiana]|uniref:Uncharacterized protein n=1 Tax=Sinanodonta woodiana TaxID=1069815 RepID=A0ABD3V623_SINWO